MKVKPTKGFTLMEIAFALVIISAIAMSATRVFQINSEINRVKFISEEIKRLRHAIEYYYLDTCLITPYPQPSLVNLASGGYMDPQFRAIADVEFIAINVANARTGRAQATITIRFHSSRLASRFAQLEGDYARQSDFGVDFTFQMPTSTNWRAAERNREYLIMGSETCY